jgi:hypothetical protein
MCDLQKLVTKGLIEERQRGRVRTIPVSIVNAATGEKIDECPQPHELKDLLDDLWRWVEDTKDMNPFARAFAFTSSLFRFILLPMAMAARCGSCSICCSCWAASVWRGLCPVRPP